MPVAMASSKLLGDEEMISETFATDMADLLWVAERPVDSDPRNISPCRGAMGIAGGLWRVETSVPPRFLSQSRPVDEAFCPDGTLGSSNRPFPRRRPRADVSARGGPGLPDPGGRAAPGEPPRSNRCGIAAAEYWRHRVKGFPP